MREFSAYLKRLVRLEQRFEVMGVGNGPGEVGGSQILKMRS